MLKADQAPYFGTCPRCGEGGLETLSTHAYCVNCNYERIYSYSEEVYSIPKWALDAIKTVKPKSIIRKLREEEKQSALDAAV